MSSSRVASSGPDRRRLPAGPGGPAEARRGADPGLVDLGLDELLSLSAREAREASRRCAGRGGPVAGDRPCGRGGLRFQARQVMDTVIDNLARAIRKLAAAGVPRAVVTADHGHLFFGTDRDESMRIDSPGGDTVELHRRCWIGRGGSTPPGCIRVSAATLGYDSDLDLVFPTGSGRVQGGGRPRPSTTAARRCRRSSSRS